MDKCKYDPYSPCEECGHCKRRKGYTYHDERHNEDYHELYEYDDGGISWSKNELDEFDD